MILSIDQGTTGTTCIVFDDSGAVCGRGYRELPQYFPKPGWVEHDLQEIWQSVVHAANDALAGAHVEGKAPVISAIGITNQRETTCVWERGTGKPLHRAIVWQDRRTAQACDQLRADGHEPLLRERTGLVLDAYFSATKIAWLLEHVDGLRQRAKDGEVCFGTVDSWLLYKLTGAYATDVTNASRTLLMNLQTLAWDDELLELFAGIPKHALPEIQPSSGEFGRVQHEDIPSLAGVPVSGIAGDQQAALYGQGCFEAGEGKNTYGTGSFVLLNAGKTVPKPREGLLTTVGWQLAGEKPVYALEAAIFITGAAIQWLRDGLGIIHSAADTQQLAESLQSNEGVYFVPALTGLGAPHWDPYARGMIIGLTRGTTRAHLVRAALEAIAYQTVDAVQAMEAASGYQLKTLKADGGATVNDWLMQFQADVLNAPLLVSALAEITAFGAAALAARGIGMWNDDFVRAYNKAGKKFQPVMDPQTRERILYDWQLAVERSRGWAE